MLNYSYIFRQRVMKSGDLAANMFLILKKGGFVMPEFGTPFNGNKCDRKLTREELIRAIRFSLASEYEAIQFYEQLQESIDNEDAKKLSHEIAGDEKVHVGNFQHLLELIAPEEEASYKKGREEAVKVINGEDE